jgi:hypothetical protein
VRLRYNSNIPRSRTLSIDKNGDPWCDYCGGPCGMGVYTSKSYLGKIFCEKECRDKFWVAIQEGEEPDIVY